MHAQEELKTLWTEIDQRSDRALVGIRKVRSTAKIEALPSQQKIVGLQFALFAALAASIVFIVGAGN